MYLVYGRQLKNKRCLNLTNCLLLVGLCVASIAPVQAGADSGNAKKVEAQSLQVLAVYPQYKAPASVLTLNDSQLSAEVSAVVDSISVKVGQTVKRGDLLVSLHKKDYQCSRKVIVLNSDSQK